MVTKATSAGPAEAIAAAVKTAIDFDSVLAHSLLTRMADSTDDGKTAKADRENASLEFVQFAAVTLAVNFEAGIPRATITDGFVKHLDAMRPTLLAEGNTFVESTTNEKTGDITLAWKGHGNNVKSIAKGVCEFAISDDDDDSTPDFMIVGEAESFTEVKQAVEVARRFGEDQAVADLREAKQRLRDACKELVSAVIKSDDIELISFQAESVEEMLEVWNQDLATVAEIEAIALDADTPIVIPGELGPIGASVEDSGEAIEA